MILLDANVLIYAHNLDAPEPPAAAAWLTRVLAGNEDDGNDGVGIPWVTIWAFVRICTNTRLWKNPRSLNDIFGIVSGLISNPRVVLLDPGPRHREILQELVVRYDSAGPKGSDAVAAALALEYDATIATLDDDFRRFLGLRTLNPLAG